MKRRKRDDERSQYTVVVIPPVRYFSPQGARPGCVATAKHGPVNMPVTFNPCKTTLKEVMSDGFMGTDD